MVYDVSEKRVYKVLKVGRKYVTWIQNSVLEGEITDSNFYRLKEEVKKIINKDEDSVLFYILRDTKYSEKENLGIIKNSDNRFL